MNGEHWREKLTFATINAVNTFAIKRGYAKLMLQHSDHESTARVLAHLKKKGVTNKQAYYLASKLWDEIKKG